MTVNRSRPEEIADALRERCRRGSPGDSLGTRTRLSSHYHAAPGTIAGALRILEGEGWIHDRARERPGRAPSEYVVSRPEIRERTAPPSHVPASGLPAQVEAAHPAKWHLVAEALRRRFREAGPGTAVAPDGELARELNVSVGLVKDAMLRLIAEGYVSRAPGIRARVADPLPDPEPENGIAGPGPPRRGGRLGQLPRPDAAAETTGELGARPFRSPSRNVQPKFDHVRGGTTSAPGPDSQRRRRPPGSNSSIER